MSRPRVALPGLAGRPEATSAIATATIGRLIQKTLRQPKVTTSSPPMGGPSPVLSAVVEFHTPIARARRAVSGYASATSARLLGTRKHPPTAWRTRDEVSSSAL